MKRLMLFAPGAGAPSSHPWMQNWKHRMSEIGDVETFDYAYMREGRKRPRSIAQAHRGASRSIEPREKTLSGRNNDLNRQEHGWPRWLSCFARRKSGRAHLPWIPALRDGRSHKTPR